MRLSLFAAAAMLAVSLASFASPITYNLTLTPSAGSAYGGNGSFTLASAPSSTGISDFTLSSGLSNISFVIGGQTFDLTNYTSGSNTLVRFLNGSLNNITFSATTGVNPNRFSIATSSGYVFYYNNNQSAASGTFTASVAPAAVTPEPSSFALLGTGLLGVAGVLRKRFA